MKKFKSLQLNMLSNYISNVHICDRPSNGWIRSIRTALGMSARQLAERLKISQQAISRHEESEVDYSITFKTLKKIAEAMDCKLVYAIIPNEGTLKNIIEKQAYKKAKEIVDSVNHTMLLEAQTVENLEEQISKTSAELSEELNSKLWNK